MIESLIVAAIVAVAAALMGRRAWRRWRALMAPKPDCESGASSACQCEGCPVAGSRDACPPPSTATTHDHDQGAAP